MRYALTYYNVHTMALIDISILLTFLVSDVIIDIFFNFFFTLFILEFSLLSFIYS